MPFASSGMLDLLRRNARPHPLQCIKKLLIVLRCTDGEAEGIRSSPAAAHVAHNDSVTLQLLAEASSVIAYSAEQKVRPGRCHADSHLRDSFRQQLCAS